jgi:hypothetical protein
MKKDFKSIAFLAVFTMIAGCAFYCIGFYDSAIFTLLSGLTMLAVYHAGACNLKPIYGYISGFWDIRAAKNKKSYSKMKENR